MYTETTSRIGFSQLAKPILEYKDAPAFDYALSMLFGALFSCIGLITLPFALLFFLQNRSLPLIILMTVSFYYVHFSLPPKISDAQIGTAYFHPKVLKKTQASFGWRTQYTGTIIKFSDGINEYKNLPCHIFRPLYGKHPNADTDYLLEGTLIQKSPNFSLFKPTKWTAALKSSRFTGKRYRLKNKLRKFLRKRVKKKKTYLFFATLLTGDLEERSLKYEFDRLAQSHILAISGFHFAMLSLFLTFFLSRFFPLRSSAFSMMVLLTLFFIYIGPTASITRAWIALLIPLSGRMISRKCSALNALSIAFILSFLINPLNLLSLGFQLSYLATFGLITLTAPIDKALWRCLPKRKRKEALSLSFIEKHIYLLAGLIRNAVALSFAVNFFTLPLLLHVFGRYPLLSFFYNLFYPFGVTISLFFVLLSLLFPFLMPLTELYTLFLIRTVTYAPTAYSFLLYVKSLPLPWLLFFFFIPIALTKITHLLENKDSFFYGDRSSVG
ncbi:MAG: ComEC/Rec2 family competence protein [Simkaniaceae bacterium]